MYRVIGGVDRPYDYEVDDQPRQLKPSYRLAFGCGIAFASLIGMGLVGDVVADSMHISEAEKRSTMQNKLGQIARTLSGDEDLELFCADIKETPDQISRDEVTHGQYGKSVLTGMPTILIDERLCASLYLPDMPVEVQHVAMLTLAHEAAHAKGIDDEGVANCEGVKLFSEVYRELSNATYDSQSIKPLELAQSFGNAEYHTQGC